MSKRPTPRLRRRWIIGATFTVWLVTFVGLMIVMPRIQHAYFFNWWASQDSVIDQLTEQQRWEAALERVDFVAEKQPWDPRPDHRRAEILLRREVSRGAARPEADPEVLAAFEHVGRRYFKNAMYPYLLSTRWQSQMGDAYQNWGVCALAQGQHSHAAFSFGYSADVDPTRAPRIIQILRGYTESHAEVEPEIIHALVRIAIRHRSPDEGRALLEAFAGKLSAADRIMLEFECDMGQVWLTEPSVSATEVAELVATDLPFNLTYHTANLEFVVRRQTFMRADMRETTANDSALLTIMQRDQFVDMTRRAESSNPPVRVNRVNLWRMFGGANGEELTFTWESQVFQSDDYHLVARGAPALGVWPAVEVIANGGEPQLFYVESDRLRAYHFDVPGGELNTLTVRFLNDGGFPILAWDESAGKYLPEKTVEDRNVWIQGVWAELKSEEST